MSMGDLSSNGNLDWEKPTSDAMQQHNIDSKIFIRNVV
jgi:hypothetical protein